MEFFVHFVRILKKISAPSKFSCPQNFDAGAATANKDVLLPDAAPVGWVLFCKISLNMTHFSYYRLKGGSHFL